MVVDQQDPVVVAGVQFRLEVFFDPGGLLVCVGWLLIVSVVHPVVELRGSRCDRCWDLASLGSPGRRLNQSTSGLMSTLVRVRILPIILPIIGSELRGV